MIFYSISSLLIVGIKDIFRYLWDDRDKDMIEFVDIYNLLYRGKLKKIHYTPGEGCLYFFKH